MFKFINPKIESFGLDISDVSIKVAKLASKRGKLELVSYGRQNIADGVIEKGAIKKKEELSEIINKAVNNVKGKKINDEYVVCSLPEQEAFIRLVQLPRLKKEELKEAIKWEIEENIPLKIDEVYFDYFIVHPVRGGLDHIDVLIGALPKIIVDNYVQVLKDSGLKLKALEIESVATSRALVKDGKSPYPILIIDVGARRTSFTVFSGYTPVLTSSSHISNNYLLEILADNLGIDTKEAKKMKFKYGLNDSSIKNKVTKALKIPLQSMIAEANKYMAFYQQHSEHEHGGGRDIKEIILCGGGASLEGLDVFLANETNIPVRSSDPWINILQEPIKKTPPITRDESLGYATALGLALYGITN